MKIFKRTITIIITITMIMSLFSFCSFGESKTCVSSLTKVMGISLKQTSDSKIKISWNKQPDAKGYQVWRATSKSGKYYLKKTTKQNYFTNTNLKIGKTYYYKIRAYKYKNGKKVYGRFSSVKSLKMTYMKPHFTLYLDGDGSYVCCKIKNNRNSKSIYLNGGVLFWIRPSLSSDVRWFPVQDVTYWKSNGKGGTIKPDDHSLKFEIKPGETVTFEMTALMSYQREGLYEYNDGDIIILPMTYRGGEYSYHGNSNGKTDILHR